ncbi:MAG: MFS transporter, partial [Herbaspirillum sp.]
GVDFGLISQGASALSFLRMMGGAIGVSLVGIVLEWRLAVHHVVLTDSAVHNVDRVRAFNETFWFVSILCALAMIAAWRMRAKPSATTSVPGPE